MSSTTTFLNDPQGSIGMVTDDTFNPATSGPIPQNQGYDTFGQPRNANGAPDPNWGANAITKQGYINQEHLTDIRLIDLNARTYDPQIGQFLSPDPVISDEDDSQAWNAYAYSHNNPMSWEDPSGLLDAPAMENVTVTADRLPLSFGPDDAVSTINMLSPFAGVFKSQPIEFVTVTAKRPSHGARYAAGGAEDKAYEDNTQEQLYDQQVELEDAIRKLDPTASWLSNPEEGPSVAGNEALRKQLAGLEAKVSGSLAPDQNKLDHIFGNIRHGLLGIVDRLGSQGAAMNVLQRTTEAAVQQQGLTGVFETTVQVSGETVTVRGNVLDGNVFIRTAFIPSASPK